MHSLASKRTGIYERALAAKLQREEKLEALRDQRSRQDYSFTPKTAKSHRTIGTTRTSGGSCLSNNSILQSQSSSAERHADVQSRGGSSVVSSRIEDLYQRQVAKLRMKPKTANEERVFRDRLYEERELQQCTFRPNLSSHKRQPCDPPEVGVVRVRARPARLVTTPHRFNPRTAPNPPVPIEIAFEVDDVDLNAVIHPYAPHRSRPRLVDMTDSPILKDASSPKADNGQRKSRRPKPGRIKRRKRSRRRRAATPEPDVGSI